MDYGIIKQILSLEDVSAEEKLSMISKIIKQFERIDNYSKAIAAEKGGKPTLDDKYQAMLQIADEIGVTLNLDEKEIDQIINSGLSYVMSEQLDNGGWGRDQKRYFPDTIHTHINSDRSQPVATPWDTCMAISILTIWDKICPGSLDVKESILEGLKWLKEDQDSNGAWREVDRHVRESPPNILQTGLAISVSAYGGSHLGLEKDFAESIQAGLEFLVQHQDTETGGSPTVPGDPPDVKATSMSVIASSLANGGILAKRGIDWLITHQTDEGDWGYVRTSAYPLFGIYYGITALDIYRFGNRDYLLENVDFRKKIDRAIRKALNWYVGANKLIRHQERYRWVWKDGGEIADTANTPAAIIVLLDCAEDDFSFIMRKGVEWLINQRDQDTYWGIDTSLVLLSLIKYIKPESRRHKSS
jgi:hypothetical protein